MSGVSIAQKSLNITQDGDGQAAYISVGVRGTTGWQNEFDAALRNVLAEAGYRQPTEPVKEIPNAPPDPWRIVAPGIAVRASEYAIRYGHLDLDGLRTRLTSEAFRAFVRHIGIFRGPEGLDVDQIVGEEIP